MPMFRKESRLLAISDIHGHTDGLLMLLQKAGYCPGMDRLILLGDYIDNDPATWGALSLVKELVDQGARALPGNQEMYLINEWKKGLEVPVSLIRWLKGLPYYIEEDDYLFVHAGIRPGIPLNRQAVRDFTEIREDFWEGTDDLRFTVIFGHTPTFKIGAEPGMPWFGLQRIGIDTGAKHGHRLTLVDVHGGKFYSCSTSQTNLYGDYRMERIDRSESEAL